VATFDQLSAEQRAIVELVLQQQKSYDELSGMLGMPEDRVRELARSALVELAPVSARGVDEEWRGQLADYVLGQQSGAQATATKGHLRRSEAARTWTRSLLDSLEQLYVNGSMPPVPEGERGRRSAAAARTAAAEAGLAQPLPPAVKRRRLIAAGAATLAALLLIVLVWPVGLLTGGDDNSQPSADEGSSAAQNGSSGQAQTAGGAPAGIAIVVEQKGKRQLLVQAANLKPSEEREAYEVWLYNSRGDARSLGGQVTDQQGTYQAVGDLPADFADYRYIDVSREPLDQNRQHSGDSALRGPVPKLRTVKADGKQTAVLGQSVLKPPSG
jgi:hypothetical protein